MPPIVITDMVITVITKEQMEHLRYARPMHWPYCYHQHMRMNVLMASAEFDEHVHNGDRRCLKHVQRYCMNLHGDSTGLLTRVFDAKE